MGKVTISNSLYAFAEAQSYWILFDLSNKGCHGNKITWTSIEEYEAQNIESRYLDSKILFTDKLKKAIETQNLSFYLDFISEPLIQGIHVSLQNSNMCGCGESFSL
jgi:Fe-S cluster assembly iron-binding protein IscA